MGAWRETAAQDSSVVSSHDSKRTVRIVGANQLGVSATGEAKGKPLASHPGTTINQVAWSADDRWISYVAREIEVDFDDDPNEVVEPTPMLGGLYVVSSKGGKPRRILQEPYRAWWTPAKGK